MAHTKTSVLLKHVFDDILKKTFNTHGVLNEVKIYKFSVLPKT